LRIDLDDPLGAESCCIYSPILPILPIEPTIIVPSVKIDMRRPRASPAGARWSPPRGRPLGHARLFGLADIELALERRATLDRGLRAS
jgi:hypothetical protein